MATRTMKGNTPRSHDHRVGWSEFFDTCVSNLGTLEGSLFIDPRQLGIASGDQYSPQYISAVKAKTKVGMPFEDSLGVCRWNTLTDLTLVCRALNAGTG